MKTSFKTSLLALACAIGLTATPQTHSIPAVTAKNAGALLVAYEIVNLLYMVKRGSKPDFKQRALLDTSRKLLKEDKKQWAKNVLKNIEIVHVDYIQGQAYKGKGLSLDPEGKVISGEKCLPAGFNGHLLGWIAAINKMVKSSKDIAIVAAAIIIIYNKDINQIKKLANANGWHNDVLDTITNAHGIVFKDAAANTTATAAGASTQDAGAGAATVTTV